MTIMEHLFRPFYTVVIQESYLIRSPFSQLFFDPFYIYNLLQQIRTYLTIYLELIGDENGKQPSCKSLLCNSWLPYWEIILLASGDVESNPGPTLMTDEQLAQVSNSIIEEDDISKVLDMVHPISGNWMKFCCILGLQPSFLITIKRDHPGNADECLFKALVQWLQKNYNTEKHGPPTWRKLVAAVDNSAGGNNHELALKIAETEKSVVPPEYLFDQAACSTSEPALTVSPKKKQAISIEFSKMYRSITQHLGKCVNVDELKEFLFFLTNPQSLQQRCVDPRVYEQATSTKEVLTSLFPDYVNPVKLFVLEGILETFCSSRQCKRLFKNFKDMYY